MNSKAAPEGESIVVESSCSASQSNFIHVEFPQGVLLEKWANAICRHVEIFKHGSPPDFAWRDAATRRVGDKVKKAKSFDELSEAGRDFLRELIAEAKRIGFVKGDLIKFAAYADLVTSPAIEAVCGICGNRDGVDPSRIRAQFDSLNSVGGGALEQSDTVALKSFCQKWKPHGLSSSEGFSKEDIGRLDEAFEQCANFLRSEYGHEMEVSGLRIVISKENLTTARAAYCSSGDYLLFRDLRDEELGRTLLHEYMHRTQFHLDTKLRSHGKGGLFDVDSESGLGLEFKGLLLETGLQFENKAKVVPQYLVEICRDDGLANFFVDYFLEKNAKMRAKNKDAFLKNRGHDEFDSFVFKFLDQLRRRNSGHFLDVLDTQSDKILKRPYLYMGLSSERHSRLTELHYAAVSCSRKFSANYPPISLVAPVLPKIKAFNQLVFKWSKALSKGEPVPMQGMPGYFEARINKEKFKWGNHQSLRANEPAQSSNGLISKARSAPNS